MRRPLALLAATLALTVATAAVSWVAQRVLRTPPRGLLRPEATQARVAGVDVAVEGGVIQSVEGRRVTVRALAPSPRISFTSHTDEKTTLHVRLANAWRRRGKTRLEFHRLSGTSHSREEGDHTVTVLPGERVDAAVTGPPELAGEFEFLLADGRGNDLVVLRDLVHRLNADPPAFAIYRDDRRRRHGFPDVGPFALVAEGSVAPVFAVPDKPSDWAEDAAARHLLGPRRVAFTHAGYRFILLGAAMSGIADDDPAWLRDQVVAAGEAERLVVFLPLPRARLERHPLKDAVLGILGGRGAWVCFADSADFVEIGADGHDGMAAPAAERREAVKAWRVRVRDDGRPTVVREWAVERPGRIRSGPYQILMLWTCAARQARWLAPAGAVLLAGWAALAALLAGRVARRAWAAAAVHVARRARWRQWMTALGVAAALAALAWLYLSGLGRMDFTTSNEAKRVQATFEMAVTGDYVVPHLNGRVYLLKPPLYYWLNAPFVAPSRPFDEFRGRLSAVLAGLGCVVVVWVFARRWLGSREAAASAAVLALSPLVYIQAREAELDMLLATLTALSLCLLFEALESRRLGLFVAGAAALAGATMTKGPVPLAIAATAVVPFLVWTRRHRWGCWRGLAVGAVVLVALVTPWCVLVVRRIGWETAWGLLMEQSVRRVASASRINSGPWHFYLTRLFATFFPWSLWLPAAAVLWWHASRRWREDAEGRALVFLACWLLPPFVFFSACAGKETQYILPLYPPLAMLVGAALVRSADGRLGGWGGRLSGWAGYIAGGAAVVGGIGMASWLGGGASPPLMAGSYPAGALAAAALVAGGTLAVVSWRRRTVAGLVLSLGLAFAGVAAFRNSEMLPMENARHSPRGFCRRVDELVPKGAPLLLYGLNRPTYSLYAARVARYVPEADRAATLEPAIGSATPTWFLMYEDTYATLTAELGDIGRCELAAHAGDRVLLIANPAATRQATR